MVEFRIPEFEDLPRRLKVFLLAITFMLIGGTIAFKIISEPTLLDAFLRTLHSLAFMFEDDASTAEKIVEILLSIVGVFLVWWVLWSFADFALEGNVRKYLKKQFYSIKMRKLKDHLIIVGGGRVGEEIARLMFSKKKPFLLIDSDPEVVHVLQKRKYIVIEGDAMDEKVLINANITSASKLIITLPKTETNILITLSAKALNPGIEIQSRCEDMALVSKLKNAGANKIIVPEILAADKIVDNLGI